MYKIALRALIFSVIFLPGLSVFLDTTRVPRLITLTLFGVLLVVWMFRGKIVSKEHLNGGDADGGSYVKIVLAGGIYVALQLYALLVGVASNASDVSSASMTMLISVVAMSFACLAAMGFRPTFASSPVNWALIALAALCAVNILAWMLGFRHQNAGSNPAANLPSATLAIFGIDTNRVLFPLSFGVNNFGAPAGLVLTYGLVRLRKNNFLPRLGVLGTVIFIVVPASCVLLTDTRAALISSIVAVSFAFAGLRYGFILMFGAALGLIYATTILRTVDFPLIAFALNRESSGDIFSGREIIWFEAISELSNFDASHLFGYGGFGQFTSGVSRGYSALLEGFGNNSDLTSLHSGLLQTVFDSGYAGMASLVILLTVLYSGYKKGYENERGFNVMCLALLNFLMLQSITEVNLTYYNMETYCVFIALTFWAWQLRYTATASKKKEKWLDQIHAA